MRKAIFCGCLLQLIFLGMLQAQTNRATITGTVTDSSGAPMSGVEVIAKNLGTNVSTSSVTNEDGIYSIPNLFPGTYSVEFQKDAFKSLKYPSMTLDSTQIAQVNAALQAGGVSETVTVTADAPVLDRENATIGTNMKGDVVTDLPMSIYNGGRFVENFAVAITPGYSPISSPYNAVINGSQYYTKDYTVDGTSATASIAGDSIETGPSMEAVEELQAQTSGLDSASAITSGGVMSFNLKSGTNKFHGSAFGYGHNELLDANTWTNDNQGLPKAKARAWDYGGSLGGPIFKNKTFFFGTFERYTQTDFTLGGFSSFVPTSAYLSGDFSAVLGPNICSDPTGNAGICGQSNGSGATFANTITVKNDAGQTVPVQAGMIFDPKTGNQFTGNVIPTSAFSSVAQKIVALYKSDYAPGGSGATAPNNRLPLNNSPAQTPNQAVIKIDHTLTDKDHLSGSWIYDHRPRTLEDSGGVWQAGTTDGGPFSAARVQLVRSDGWRVSESHTFSPTLVNVFNETYNWYWNGNEPAVAGTNWAQTLGFGNTGANNFPIISFGSVPNAVAAQGVTFIGNKTQGYFTGANIITGDTVTWTKGKHALTFGGEFRAYQVNSHLGSGALNFNFNNNATGQPNASFGPFVGYGFASFLLGEANNASQSTAFDLYGRRKALALFAQDNYKVTPKLTLNYGLRWQYVYRYHEKYGHWANFDLNAIDPTLGIPGALEFANGGGDSFERKEYWNDFGPQIGFAYSPWKKWVFRGSFGLVYLPAPEPYFNGVPNGFAPGFQGINQANTSFNWDAGYPGVFQPGSKNVSAANLFPLVSVDPHALLGGFSQAFNIGAQYELTPNMRLEVAYVGNRGHHLPDTALAWNEPSASTFLNVVNKNPGINAFNDYVCSPADAAKYGVPFPYTGFCAPALAAIAPYPQVAAAATTTWFFYNQLYVSLPIAQSFYNSMVVDLVKRTGRGLTMDVNYTLSRQQGDSYTIQTEGNNYYTPVQDFSNLSVAAHALTNYDQTHVVKGFVAYELPFGRGRRWLSNKSPVVNGIVGGWTVAGLVLYASGQPFQVAAPNNFYPAWGTFYPNFNPSGFTGTSNPRNFQVPQPNQPVPAVDFYMPTTVASAPATGQLGTGPGDNSALRCPGLANENASILKYFSMGSEGRYKLSFRVEYYNLFNRHTYNINGCGGNNGNQVGSGNFGEIFGVNNNPRTAQFAIRFTF
jgi:Carboxypeptidase regulatory-like domain/TonB dependent receptor